VTTGDANERYDRIFSGPRPSFESARLTIRPFMESDAADIELLAGDFQVAKTLLAMPHPYPPGAALEWIAKHDEFWRARKELPLAITRLDHQHAEVGYWIARASWGEGVASEAMAAVLHWAFTELELHRVFARHMATNPASGAVMRKNGLRHEGTLREHYWKLGRHHDFLVYGILRSEYFAARARP
jgi:ribosomal-protein-alanine N-acetyltransferase